MELSDEKLRQIVRETLRELGPDANPVLVGKVVREVVRQLERKIAPTHNALNRRLPILEPKTSTHPVDEKLSGSSSPGY